MSVTARNKDYYVFGAVVEKNCLEDKIPILLRTV